jgi:DnaJ domain
VQGTDPDPRRTFGRGQLVRLLYRLGRQAANGVLTLTARTGRPDVLVLRRGAAVCADGELAKRALLGRLARAVAEPSITAAFESGVAAYPPGALHQVALAGWVRCHLEAQLDGPLADLLERELAGARLALRVDHPLAPAHALAPEPLDPADRRMLAALAVPRRLDQIWPLARAPRHRLLAFLHFLRVVGTLVVEGVEAPPPRASASRGDPAPADDFDLGRARAHVAARRFDPRRAAALRLLGVDAAADIDAVKRAYRRLARTVHPDLQPGVDDQRRRVLERRFAELTAAYEALV